MSGNGQPEPIPAPRLLVDDLTVDHTASPLQRLTRWLTSSPDTDATGRCARALSLGETDDPVTIASWAHALATRLHRLAEESQLDAHRPTTEINRPTKGKPRLIHKRLDKPAAVFDPAFPRRS